jgi:hypothetical protein
MFASSSFSNEDIYRRGRWRRLHLSITSFGIFKDFWENSMFFSFSLAQKDTLMVKFCLFFHLK